MTGSMHISSILRGEVRKARGMKRVEKLCAYQNYEMDMDHYPTKQLNSLGT